MAMIDDVKKVLGISHTQFDTQLTTFINAAKKDLEMVGIKQSLIVETDPLIYSAIMSFTLSMMDTYEYRELSANAYAIQKDQLRHYRSYTGV